MAASKDEIRKWFDEGKKAKKRFMLVMRDMSDGNYYPLYEQTTEEAAKIVKRPGEMQQVIEVYDLRKDRERQLRKLRCFEI